MRVKRATMRDLFIPDVKHPDRRAECEADERLWLKTYCPSVFYNPFTTHQLKIIDECRETLLYGTQKCKAAPRGDGKSSIIKYLAKMYSLCRKVRFPLIVAATGEKAKDSLDSIKHRLFSGMRIDRHNNSCVPQTPLGEDYPLECAVAAYVHPWPSRARNVTANGQRSIHVEWGANCVILPTWEDEEPIGPIMLALGYTSDELQGCNVYDLRPDFVMIDDLDSRDSLSSDHGVIAEKIEDVVDKTIAGLGGQSRRLGKYMLCTITSRKAAAFKYSDPKQKPSWSGERVSAIIAWPDEKDGLWKEYIELRQWGKDTFEDGEPVDVFGRKAHQHYLDNREAMDAGAILANPYNFETDILPDGTQKQLSALQRCFDYIADEGMASFLTEHQNDPPLEDDAAVESGITPKLIQKQVSGYPRGVIPPGCTVLVHSCDVGKLKGFHWVVRAWRPDGTRFTIDYDVMDVVGVKYGSDEGLDRALFNAVLRRQEEFKSARYVTADGEQPPEIISLFDARWKTDVIIKAVLACGLGAKAIIGIGHSSGCVTGKFRDVVQNTTNRRKCGTSGAYEELHAGDYGKCWVVHADADRWKGFEHEGWLTARDRPGCSFLWGEPSDKPERLSPDERFHDHYANHICAEVEVEIENKRKWMLRAKQNDWLDSSYINDVGAAMKGIRVVGAAPASTRPAPKDRPSARDLANRTRANA